MISTSLLDPDYWVVSLDSFSVLLNLLKLLPRPTPPALRHGSS